MRRQANVYMHNEYAGILFETETGYAFTYASDYKGESISKTLPRHNQSYESTVLFPFFDGLVPEGWLLNIALDNWKLNDKDRFGLLLACCKNCIGAVSVIPLEE